MTLSEISSLTTVYYGKGAKQAHYYIPRHKTNTFGVMNIHLVLDKVCTDTKTFNEAWRVSTIDSVSDSGPRVTGFES